MDVRNILMVISLGLSVIIGLIVARGQGGQATVASSSNTTSSIGSTPAVVRPIIGLSLDTLKEPRWVSDRDLFIKRCGELGADIKYAAADSDDTQQAKDVNSLLANNINVLVIVPHDGMAMTSSVNAAKAAGVKVIAYDRIVMNCDLDLYVSFDNVRVGHLQGQYLADHLPTPGHGKIVRIYGSKTDHNAFMFKQGQDEALKPYIDRKDIEVVWEDWADDWRPENAKRIMNAAIASGKQFDGVLASNDGTAGGAIQALQEAGMAGKVLVTGQDADVPALQRIAAGTQTMTVYKPVKKLAELAADAAAAMAVGKSVTVNSSVNNGKKDVPTLMQDIYAVDKSNILDTVVKDGFHSYDEIYGNLPESERPPRPQ